MKKIDLPKFLRFFTVILLLLTCACSFHPVPPFRQAYLNGNILTMDIHNTIAEAVLIERGEILDVGNDQDIRSQLDDDTDVYDLGGKTMIPGIIDAHSHFPGSGLSVVAVDLNSPPIGKITEIKQALKLLKYKAEKTPEGKWVFGYGFDDSMIKEKRYFTRDELDQVSSKHPVYVMHISAHSGVANSYALQRAGVTKETPNPTGGEIQKDAETGELTGVLFETAHNPLREMAIKFSIFDQLKILKAASKDYVSKGITTAQNGLALEEHIKGLSRTSWFGMTPLRLIVWPAADTDMGERLREKEIDYTSYNTDMFHAGAIKLIADGSIQGYTGFLEEPYYVNPPLKKSDYRGYPAINKEKLFQLVEDYHSAGYQLAIHGNGDAAIEMIIDAYEAAQKNHYREDARPIIIHSQMIRDDQMDRVKQLGMTLSFFAAHTYYWGDRHRDIFLGPERSEKISPMRTALNKGIRFSIHLDTPVVPMDPMLMIWNAVHRKTTGGQVLGEDERLTGIQALRAVTIDAAWQIFQEDNRGSVEPGKFADLVILSDNPLNNPEGIRNIQVEKTLIGGVTVYQR